MKTKIIEFDSFKQNISDLIDEIANSIKESFNKSKSNIFKNMIADTKKFVDWAKDYKELDDLMYKNIIVALNNLKNVNKEELELLDKEELIDYDNLTFKINSIIDNYSKNICNKVRSSIKEIIRNKNEQTIKFSYKPTKEDLNKLCKEDLINMIINEEEPKKNQN